MKIKIKDTEIQSIGPVDCPKETALPPDFIGVVSNIEHKDGVLSFDFGPSRAYLKSKEWPEWFIDGVQVEIDFVSNTVTKR